MPYLKEKWESLSPKAQKIIQIATGIVLSLLCGVCFVFTSNVETNFLYSMLPLAIALIAPNIIETQTGNKLPLMRKSQLISLCVLLVFSLVYYYATGKLTGN